MLILQKRVKDKFFPLHSNHVYLVILFKISINGIDLDEVHCNNEI